MQTAFVLTSLELSPLEATTTFIITIIINSTSGVTGMFIVLYFCLLFCFLFPQLTDVKPHTSTNFIQSSDREVRKSVSLRKTHNFSLLKRKRSLFFFSFACPYQPLTSSKRVKTAKESDSERNF